MLLSLLLIIIEYSKIQYIDIAFSQYSNNSSNTSNRENKTNNWISKTNNLNVTMMLNPKVPMVDEKAHLFFELKKLNSSEYFKDLSARVTITDHDGRLFKFDKQLAKDGRFSVDYIFPDDGEHRIIVQLYKNNSAFAIGSFDVVIPHQKQPGEVIGDFFSNLFKNLFGLKF